jgi:hypothetical protein
VDEVTRDIQGDISGCMLFVDDVMLVDAYREGVNMKLELWKHMLELKGFRLSTTKTKYIMCNFSLTSIVIKAVRRAPPFLYFKQNNVR